jgi:hypothetical protein
MSDEIKTQKCTGMCGQVLELTKENFEWRSDTKKWRGQCRKCSGKGKPKYIIEENNIKYQICTGDCKRKLEINSDNFYIKYKTNKYNRKCINCISECSQKYYKENQAEITIRQADYYQNNKEKHKENNKKYMQIPEVKQKRKKYLQSDNQKEKSRIRTKKWRAVPENKLKRNEQEIKRKKEDPDFKIRSNISRSILKVLKSRNSKKDGSILKHLPYSIKKFRKHIEFQFLEPGNEWMNWDNWGVYRVELWDDNDSLTWKWQLDHIKPHADFEYTSMDSDEFRECWDLDNLRPLSAKSNIIEGASRTRHKKV